MSPLLWPMHVVALATLEAQSVLSNAPTSPLSHTFFFSFLLFLSSFSSFQAPLFRSSFILVSLLFFRISFINLLVLFGTAVVSLIRNRLLCMMIKECNHEVIEKQNFQNFDFGKVEYLLYMLLGN